METNENMEEEKEVTKNEGTGATILTSKWFWLVVIILIGLIVWQALSMRVATPVQ